MKPDEQLLWESFGDDKAHLTPREAALALNIPDKRVEYLCLKWSKQKRYDWGVAADLGWKLKGEK